MGWKRTYWRSGLYGDVFLLVGIASGIIVTQHARLNDMWFASRWYNWLVFAVGWVVILVIEAYLVHPKNGHYSWSQIIKPSRLWHTLIFPFMFYFSVVTLIPLFTTHSPLWAFILAICGYGLWLVMYLWDLCSPPDFSKTH